MDFDDRLLDLIEQWESSGRSLTAEELTRECPELASGLSDEMSRLQRLDATVRPASGSSVPAEVGGYRVLSLIGSGGFADVFRAEQRSSGQVVALKLIHPQRLIPGYRRRVRSETEAMARLTHPCVARLYDAGIAHTQHGERPFFAMELVDGLPLDKYAAEQRPALRQKLELLAQIADAVHHAHTRGVKHLDLKPGNILVTADGWPKVVDFGIAKVTSAGGAEAAVTQTLATARYDGVGTLPYMAPEQVLGPGGDVDVPTDVYGLGVVAYELVCGRRPYVLPASDYLEAARVIRDEHPVRPASIDRSFRGDVETVLLKALEKEPTRRYPSAAEFAADLRRVLRHEPIAARPATTWYQLRKFSRRNRALVGGVAATFVALVLGVAGTTVGLWRARLATAQSLLRASEAERQGERSLALALAGAAEATIGSSPQRSLLLAAEAARLQRPGEPIPQVYTALLRTLSQIGGRPMRRHPEMKVRETISNGLALSDRWLAAWCEGTALLWDLQSRPDQPPVVVAHGPALGFVRISGDGRWMVTPSGGDANLWDLTTFKPGSPPARVFKPGAAFNPAALSADGRWLASGAMLAHEKRPRLLLWDTHDPDSQPRQLKQDKDDSEPIRTATLSQDGKWLFAGSHGGWLYALDTSENGTATSVYLEQAVTSLATAHGRTRLAAAKYSN